MLRVLVIGHGLIGARRAQGVVRLARDGRCSLAGTVDPVARAPGLYGEAPHFADLAEVPPGSFDAAIVALPHHLIQGACLSVLRSGRPVLVEKPLGMNVEEARALTHAAAGTRSFVGYNYRFLPAVAEALRRVADGRLGRLRSIEMVLGHGGNPRSTEGWKLKPELSGGGVLVDPGVHLLDLLLCIAPDVEIAGVVSTAGFWGTGIEEDAAALFSKGPLLASLRVSLVRWVNTFRVELSGDDGYAIVEGRGGSYGPQVLRVGRRWGWNDGSERSQKETEETLDFGPRDDSLDVELGAVVAHWSGAVPPISPTGPATFREALRVAELCEAMRDRARRRSLPTD
jgi:predicted dehydrogenase